LPAGSILRSIIVNAKLEASIPDPDNFASDLTLLFDTSAPTTGDNFELGITSNSPTTNFNPGQTLAWTTGNSGIGASVAETRTDGEWTGDIDLATTEVFLGNAYTTANGTWSGTITLICDIPAGGGGGYAGWSNGEPFNEDKNGDGVSNGMAFLLGAADPNVNALGLLPDPSAEESGALVLNFSCRNAANRGASILNVQHSGALGAPGTWLTAPVPDTAGVSGPVNGVTFNVILGDPLNTVTATIAGDQADNGKLFGRVSGTE
jgi:hypothetical protein